MTKKKNNNTDQNAQTPFEKKVKPFVLVSQLGYSMMSPIIAGIAFGYFFDKWLSSQPWGLIFFTVMGIGAAYKNAFTTFGKYMFRGDDENKEDDK